MEASTHKLAPMPMHSPDNFKASNGRKPQPEWLEKALHATSLKAKTPPSEP